MLFPFQRKILKSTFDINNSFIKSIFFIYSLEIQQNQIQFVEIARVKSIEKKKVQLCYIHNNTINI